MVYITKMNLNLKYIDILTLTVEFRFHICIYPIEYIFMETTSDNINFSMISFKYNSFFEYSIRQNWTMIHIGIIKIEVMFWFSLNGCSKISELFVKQIWCNLSKVQPSNLTQILRQSRQSFSSKYNDDWLSKFLFRQ